jgi:hypothetical protein
MTTPPLVPTHLDLNGTIGPIFLGFVLSTALFGFEVSQVLRFI